MTREQKLTAEVKAEAEALCAKILKAIGPQKQVVAMNALYLAMQVVDSVSWLGVSPTNVELTGSGTESG